MANEFIARKGLKVLSSGIQITGSSQFSAEITASGNIKANAFYGDGANVTGVISSSYATTSSLATGGIVTASSVGSTINFTKGDGSSFPVTVTVGNSATASYVEYTDIANKPALVSASSQIDHDLTTNFVTDEHIDHSTVSISAGSGLSGGGDITTSRTLSLDTSSAHFTSGVKSKLNSDGVFSSSVQVVVSQTTGIGAYATTGSNTFNGTEIVSGNIILADNGQIRIINDEQSTLFGFYDGTNILGAYYQMWGTDHASTTQRGSAEFVYDNRSNADANFHVASFNGSTWTQKFIVNDGGIQVTGSAKITGNVTASAYTGSFIGDGSGLTGIATALTISGSSGGTDTVNLKTDTLIFAGDNGVSTTISDNKVTLSLPTGTVSSSGQVSYTGLSNVPSGIVSSSGQVSYTGLSNVPSGIVSSSGQVDHNQTTNYVANQHVDHSTVSITAGSGLSGGGDITATRTVTLDTSSAHFTNGVKTKLNTEGVFSSSAQVQYGSISGTPSGIVSSSGQVSYTGLSNIPSGIVSSSGQIDVRNTTGIATIATTGSNTFSGVQTITNTTNSTNYTDGALIVYGGVGIAKDVNISGSLNVSGVLTVASMSTQYVTSSQYTVGTSRIILNDDDLVRFAGISVIDSGSTAGSGSLLWDSLNNHWIYQNETGAAYNSAIIIAGPKNYGSLGDETGLVAGRIPVATGDDHIDTALASSSMYIDFADGKVYVEKGLYVTGSISSSVGFWGDGSNLTGVVSTLAVTGSDGASITTGTVNLKTQAITYSAGEGIDISVSGQTVSISGEDASTTNKGIASFTGSNFNVTSGVVSSKAINFNGTDLHLGGTYAFGLQNITSQGASTSDQVTLSGGAIINGVLHTSATTTVTSPANSVVATVATSSYDAAHFDYVLKSETNLRTGTVLAVWQTGSANIEFTDTSTADIGDTLSESFTVDLLSGNARLKLTGDSSTWTVKTAIRLI